MLPEVRLDRENFEEILEDARGMISSVYPEWTNYNYHDPGITILELFSFFKEIQQFHLDQVSREHRKKFAKLLGIRQEGPEPARMLARVRTGAPLFLKRGTRCYSKDLCFETDRQAWLPGGGILRCRSEFRRGDTAENVTLEKEQLEPEGRFKFYPFGTEPQPGDGFEITLETEIPAGKSCRMYLQIYEDYEVRRNDMTGPLPFSLADIAAECWTDSGWMEAELLEDTTYGLLKSGWMEIGVPEESSRLRLSLLREEYDVAPVIIAMGADYIELVQKDTCICSEEVLAVREEEANKSRSLVWADCSLADTKEAFVLEDGLYRKVEISRDSGGDTETAVCYQVDGELETGREILMICCRDSWKDRSHVGWGNGFPDQQFELEAGGMILGPVRLLISDVMDPSRYRQWTQVEDFDSSGPEDFHYMVDRERGTVIFGDAVHGMAPEGDIRLIHLEITQGAAGNVKAGEVQAEASLLKDCVIVSVQDGNGGRSRESAEEMYERLERSFGQEQRAISGEDICRLIKNVPGLMVKACRIMEPDAFEDEQTVGVVVRPYSESGIGRLSQAYRKNLLAYLEPRRLIGTRLEIRSPEYIGLNVYVEIRAGQRYLNAGEMVADTVRGFFREQEDEFGKPVIRGKLYGRIDSLDAVEEISMLTLEARGNRVVRNAGGDLFLPPYGVCLLEKVECRIVNG